MHSHCQRRAFANPKAPPRGDEHHGYHSSKRDRGLRTAEEGMLTDLQAEIDHCFAASSVSEIMILLQVIDASWAQKALKTLNNNSSFNLEITYKLLNLKDTNSRKSLDGRFTH